MIDTLSNETEQILGITALVVITERIMMRTVNRPDDKDGASEGAGQVYSQGA
jgi:hypothetical protein